MIPGGTSRQQGVVGSITFAVLVAAAVFVVAILPRLDLGGGIHVRITFGNVGALKEGAPVIVAGHTVGKVEAITITDSGAVAHLRIDDELRRMVPSNGDFFVSSKGILSDRYLEVGPPRDGAPMGPPVVDGQQVAGIDPPSLDRAMYRTWDNLVQSRAFIEAVQPEAQALRESLESLADTIEAVAPTPGAYADLALRLRALVDEASDLRDLLDEAGANPARLGELADRARATLERARAAVASVRTAADRLIADVDRVRASVRRHEPELERLRAALVAGDALLARADQLTANAQELIATLRRGEGSMAKLASDPEFPEDAKALGKIMKRSPWKIIGRPDDAAGLPARAPRRE